MRGGGPGGLLQAARGARRRLYRTRACRALTAPLRLAVRCPPPAACRPAAFVCIPRCSSSRPCPPQPPPPPHTHTPPTNTRTRPPTHLSHPRTSPPHTQALPDKEARAIVAQVLSALVYLNTKPRSIIHYDLKPANILFTRGGECKVTVRACVWGGGRGGVRAWVGCGGGAAGEATPRRQAPACTSQERASAWTHARARTHFTTLLLARRHRTLV